MENFVARSIRELPPSGIRRFFDIATQMKDVVSLGIGEPDFATPWNIREEAIFSLERRRTMYTENAGKPELCGEISRYMAARFGLRYSPASQVLVTVGASEGIDVALRAILNPGDEVLVAEPCFVSYKPCVAMAGGVPVPASTREENGFRLTARDIEARLTAKTKAVLLSYPNNPTGAVMGREDLEPIAALLRERDIVVISDEVYAELTYGDTPHTSIAALPGMAEKTIVLNGFSKAFAMTGWRLGYACGPEALIAAMTKIHQYVVMCAPTMAQYGGIEALRGGAAGVSAMRREYDARRRYLLNELRRMGMECFEACGAFYLFPSVRRFGLPSEEFCGRLLQERRLAVVPGTAFGDCGEGHIRCSYACSMDTLREAAARLRAFLSSL
ncbi:MAG: aminotransferase class I/II-fold pyridoxal phosphate-dependent enzyme [Oscillospiraceae bacterium]|jgi:aminotransferase|nr:aminotransferase class I/II-fold pyridoxal phosphate-dependent enzyme [Oscillospiraceae bacterium]